MSQRPDERMERGAAQDPLAPTSADRRPWWRWPLDAVLVIALVLLISFLGSLVPEPEPQAVEDVVLDFIPFDEPPIEEAPAAVEDDAGLEVEEETQEPEPEPEPEPTPPEPTPEPPREREPRPEPPAPVDLPEGNPQPLQEDERPIRIGLEAQSFDESEGADGPAFAAGDTARGGRPSTRSADERRAVAGASETGTGDSPAREAERPTARPRRGSGGSGNSRASLRRGISRTVPYPSAARERGIEASCTARIRIGADGAIEEVSAVSCDESGHGFEDALERHIRANFRFDPETVEGVPQATEIRWRHDFRIDS